MWKWTDCDWPLHHRLKTADDKRMLTHGIISTNKTCKKQEDRLSGNKSASISRLWNFLAGKPKNKQFLCEMGAQVIAKAQCHWDLWRYRLACSPADHLLFLVGHRRGCPPPPLALSPQPVLTHSSQLRLVSWYYWILELHSTWFTTTYYYTDWETGLDFLTQS